MQGHRDFRTLSDYILSFVITYLYIENKFGKMNEKKQKNAFPGNLMMRVSLLYLNFVLENKCNSKCSYRVL
jgi:hypothetical protein